MRARTLFSLFNKKTYHHSLLGINITSEGIALAHVSRQSASPRLLHCEFQPLAPEDDPAAILQMRIRQLGLQKVPVSTCLSASEFSLQMLEAPNVEPAEMQQAIRWSLKDQVDFDIKQAVLDIFEIPQQKERGRTPMVYVVMAQQHTVQQRVEQMAAAEVNLQYIDIPQLAQRNISQLLEEDQAGLALLSFAEHTSLLTLCQQGSLYLTREIEQGMNRLAAGEQQAVAGSDLNLVENTSIRQDAVNSVVLELQRSLDYYESHFALPPITNLALAPAEAPLEEVAELIGQASGIRVRVCDLNTLLDADIEIEPLLQARCFLAIGLALREIA